MHSNIIHTKSFSLDFRCFLCKWSIFITLLYKQYYTTALFALCFNLQAFAAFCCIHLIHITLAQEQRLTTHTGPLTLLAKTVKKKTVYTAQWKLLLPLPPRVLGLFYFSAFQD